jgi:hypothetical protein
MDEQEQYRARRRKRRRQQRTVTVLGFVLLSTGLAWFFESQATTTVIVTRYADLATDFSSDPDLSPAGESRANELARVLGDADVIAGVDVIFVTPDKRSAETGAPLARRGNVPVVAVENPADVKGLVKTILSDYKGKIALVITESDVIQPLIDEMHGSKKLPPIAAAEHDNIYIVTIPWFGKVKTLRLHYGAPYPESTPQASF